MNSIRMRLTRRLLVAMLLLLILGLFAIYAFARGAVIAGFDTSLRTKALAVSTNTEQGPAGVRVQFTDRFMRGFGDRVAHDFYEIRRADGSEVHRSRDLLGATLPDIAGTLEHPIYWDLPLVNGLPGRAVGFAFSARPAADLPKGTPLATLRIVVAGNRTGLERTLWRLAAVLGATGAVLLAAVLFFLPRILRSELLPLEELSGRMSEISANSLSMRVPEQHLPSELLPIATKLNDLLERLEKSFNRERRFSADLSHELRTPLAELRTWAEYAQMWPESRADDSEVLGIARQMEGIVSRMLVMARSERGQLAIVPESVGLAATLENTWRQFGPRAEAKLLTVTLETVPVSVCTDPVLLRSILLNLFDNAVEYTPEKGAIAVRCALRGNLIDLSFSNTVESFAPADLEKIFERFWRKESSRTGEEHAGLGLCLAREFARALGLELSARLPSRTQLCFSVQGLTVSA